MLKIQRVAGKTDLGIGKDFIIKFLRMFLMS